MTSPARAQLFRRLISLNSGLNFNPDFVFFYSKAFFQIVYSILLGAFNHEILNEKTDL